MSGGVRVPTKIGGNVRKMIQDIKEIITNHSDDEIYAMLKECDMDPNETAQKLLLLDTFHEVKRKRDRRKENPNSRETVDPRQRPGYPGRGGRLNSSSRYAAHDAVGPRKLTPRKENGINQTSEREGLVSPSLAAQEMTNKETNYAASSVTVMANDPVIVSGGNQEELSAPKSPIGAIKSSNLVCGVEGRHGEPLTPMTLSDVSDPLLVPSNNSWIPGVVGAAKCEVENLGIAVELDSNVLAVSEIGSPTQGKMGGKSQGVGKNHLEGSSFSSHGGSSSSRPSSNYGRQQAIGPQKVVPTKEWKPKLTITNSAQGSKTADEPAVAHSLSSKSVADSEETTTKLSKELEGLHVREAQHVIIPNHIHVPDTVRTSLSFGSFDAAFFVNSAHASHVTNDTNPEHVSDTQHRAEETIEEHPRSNESEFVLADEEDCIDHSEAATHIPESLSSGNVYVPSSSLPDSIELKETAAGPQHPILSALSSSFVSPMLGNLLAPTESSEAQTPDMLRVPSFMQPVDPASFYAQFYRSGVDGDGGVSPFPSAGIPTKYTGNIAALSSHPSQSLHEGGNSSISSQTSGPTQAPGFAPGSIAVNQQPVPIFRHPAGIHMAHYPPNYIPYGHYFSPFYVPPPTLHQFLSGGAFAQQAPEGAVKYPFPQYKFGNNAGNAMHVGPVGSYGPYGSSPSGYNPGSSAAGGNSASNEDLASSQFKDGNIYVTGQQSEGSAMRVPQTGHDVLSMPANTFYNLPSQGQHVTFTPTQGGHGGFPGIYHPATAQPLTGASSHSHLPPSQAMTGPGAVAGPTASTYQPQHSQIKWPNNY